MVQVLGKKNSIFNQFIAEIRDANIQTDSMRFRKNLERIGEIFAYEISTHLEYQNISIETTLGIAEMSTLKQNIVLATILRAGLPMHQGLLNYFDKAESAFVSAFRMYHKDNTFDIKINYMSSPDLEDKYLIISDPMLATGSSMFLTYSELVENSTPIHTHLVTGIASKEGIKYIEKYIPADKFTLWVGAIDDELTAKSYIVPGLGDAGDLAYGEKSL